MFNKLDALIVCVFIICATAMVTIIAVSGHF